MVGDKPFRVGVHGRDSDEMKSFSCVIATSFFSSDFIVLPALKIVEDVWRRKGFDWKKGAWDDDSVFLIRLARGGGGEVSLRLCFRDGSANCKHVSLVGVGSSTPLLEGGTRLEWKTKRISGFLLVVVMVGRALACIFAWIDRKCVRLSNWFYGRDLQPQLAE